MKKNSNWIFIILLILCITIIILLSFKLFTNKNNNLMMEWQQTSISDFHSPEYKEKIIRATFVETKEIPENAIKTWDVSMDKTESVIAYIMPDNSDSNFYNLYIGADGKVIASESLSYIFHNFPELLSVDMGSLDAKNVNIMWRSFSSSPKLISVVLPTNTNSLKNINAIFSGCSSLVSVNLSNMYLENIEDIGYAFSGCSKLTNINFGDFTATKVEDFSYTFSGCNMLTKLNISQFKPESLKKVSHMFNWSNRLENLDISQINFNNIEDDASAIFYKMPTSATVYVKDEQTKQWILSLSEDNRPAWTDANIVVK